MTIVIPNRVYAQQWVDLGSRKVNFDLDREYAERIFTAIKLEVTDGALSMLRLSFGEGITYAIVAF